MAKNKTTVPTFTYVVYTNSTFTITDTATGRPLQTAYPGIPNYFTAIGDSVTLIDDSAIILKPVFKCAPDALGLLVGGPKLPAGYTPLSFVETTGGAFVELDYNVTPATGVKFRVYPKQANYMVLAGNMSYAPDSEKNFYAMISYRGCVGFYVGRAYYFLRDGGYASSGTQVTEANGYKVVEEEVNAQINWKNSGDVHFQAAELDLKRPLPKAIPTYDAPFFIGTQGAVKYNNFFGRVMHFSISDGPSIVHDCLPALNADGRPCFYDLAAKNELPNTGTAEFIAGVGSNTQLSEVLRKLPANGGSLALSLPAEANTPEFAAELSACQVRTGKTITVYEYRPAAVANYSLRRVRQVLWCRAIPDTLGNYVNAAGNRVHIEQCVAIFGPLGSDPNAYGFAPYDSLDHATESLGLTPYLPENNNETE